jgi:predicted metallopeptidase
MARLKKALKFIKSKSSKKNLPVVWENAPDIKLKVEKILDSLGFSDKNKKNIYYFRSSNSTANARARIWGMSKIWQQALPHPPSYIIEVISEKFDHLNDREKEEILIHEIAHIPNNFSGSLVPHFRRGKRKFSTKVDLLIGTYLKRKS